MDRYVALLRGIGPANPNMSNARLRGVLEQLGMERVSSVLSSGNILFSTTQPGGPALEARIQQALHDTLGIPGGTILRGLPELQALLESDPFPGLTHGRGTYLTATFLKDGTDHLVGLPPTPDPRTRVVGYDEAARVFLAVIDNSDPGRTPDFMTWLERTYGKDITTRTWLTVQRIVARLAA